MMMGGTRDSRSNSWDQNKWGHENHKMKIKVTVTFFSIVLIYGICKGEKEQKSYLRDLFLGNSSLYRNIYVREPSIFYSRVYQCMVKIGSLEDIYDTEWNINWEHQQNSSNQPKKATVFFSK